MKAYLAFPVLSLFVASAAGCGDDGGSDSGADTVNQTGDDGGSGMTAAMTSMDDGGSGMTTMGMTGADSGTDSGSGETGTPEACEPAADDDECATCTKTNCCDDLAACQDDAGCACAVACVSEMGLDMLAACLEMCELDALPMPAIGLNACVGSMCADAGC